VAGSARTQVHFGELLDQLGIADENGRIGWSPGRCPSTPFLRFDRQG
jgi:hypothetical protein